MRSRRNLFILCVILLALIDVLLMRSPIQTARAAGIAQHAHALDKHNGISATSKQAGQQTSAAGTFFSGNYTLRATEIIGTNAHLSLAPDPLHPVLTFTSSTISGLRLSHPMEGVTMTISSPVTVTTGASAIKTSIFSNLVTALGSFTNKADLLILVVGGTVKSLVMTNVTLSVDTYIHLDTFDAPQFHLVVS